MIKEIITMKKGSIVIENMIIEVSLILEEDLGQNQILIQD